MIAVFVSAYFFSKYVGKRYGTRSGPAKNISILECRNIGKDGTLLIVKAGERAFLVGATPRAFTFLSELDPDTLEAPDPPDAVKKDFSAAFKTAIKSLGKKQDEGEH